MIGVSCSEVIGIGACDARTAAAIKARLAFRLALHRFGCHRLQIPMSILKTCCKYSYLYAGCLLLQATGRHQQQQQQQPRAKPLLQPMK